MRRKKLTPVSLSCRLKIHTAESECEKTETRCQCYVEATIDTQK